MKLTPCECEKPGWCQRHQCEKSRHYFELCRRREDWFELYEKKQTPIQQLRTAQRETQNCQYRTAVIDEVLCPSCRGKVKIKVFGCKIHKRCTDSRQIEQTAVCLFCDDFSLASATL